MLKQFWDALDIVKILALLVAAAYVALVAFSKQPDETLKNIFLLIAGYYFGSSAGSKAKDEAMLRVSPPPTPPSPSSTAPPAA